MRYFDIKNAINAPRGCVINIANQLKKNPCTDPKFLVKIKPPTAVNNEVGKSRGTYMMKDKLYVMKPIKGFSLNHLSYTFIISVISVFRETQVIITIRGTVIAPAIVKHVLRLQSYFSV